MPEGNGEARVFFHAKLPLIGPVPYKNNAFRVQDRQSECQTFSLIVRRVQNERRNCAPEQAKQTPFFWQPFVLRHGVCMIVALYALALAMIVGGLLAAILGWDIVLVERGWTMVISGIIGASGGAVLLGIAVIVSKLARIEQELARVQLSLEDDVETVIVPTSAEQARGRIIDDVASDRVGALAGFFGSRHASSNPVMGAVDQDNDTSAEAEETRLDDEEERVPFELRSATPPELTEPPAAGERSGGHEIDEVSEGKVPDFLFAERYQETVITETQYPEREAPALAPDPDPELADEHAAAGKTDT